MARPTLPDLSPWRRHPLQIPPDSVRTWLRLVLWESWMGMLLCSALVFGVRLIRTAPTSIVTISDYTGCFAADVAKPCEGVAYRAGSLNLVLNLWCGILMMIVAAWLVWELWNAVKPKPITDDFLTLLDDSFGRDWRHPRTWPWTRLAWAYGFALVGAGLTIGLGLLATGAI